MRALRKFMRGVAKVHWTESRSTGTRLGAYTEHYNAEVEYFFKRQVLFGRGSSFAEICFLPPCEECAALTPAGALTEMRCVQELLPRC